MRGSPVISPPPDPPCLELPFCMRGSPLISSLPDPPDWEPPFFMRGSPLIWGAEALEPELDFLEGFELAELEDFPAVFRLGLDPDSVEPVELESLLAVWVCLPPQPWNINVPQARSARMQNRRIVFLKPRKCRHLYRYDVETAVLFPIPVFYGQKESLASEITPFSGDFRRLPGGIFSVLRAGPVILSRATGQERENLPLFESPDGL